jgi:hypothetical protein
MSEIFSAEMEFCKIDPWTQPAYCVRAPPQTNAAPLLKPLTAPTIPYGNLGKERLAQLSSGQKTSTSSRYL